MPNVLVQVALSVGLDVALNPSYKRHGQYRHEHHELSVAAWIVDVSMRLSVCGVIAHEVDPHAVNEAR